MNINSRAILSISWETKHLPIIILSAVSFPKPKPHNQLSPSRTLNHPSLKNMRFSYPLIFAMGALSSVNAECWKSGPSTSKDAIQGYIQTVCNYLQSPGYLKGEERYQCVQDLNRVKWDFSLKVDPLMCSQASLTSSQQIGQDISRPITATECESGMNKQADCTYKGQFYGGETSYTNWKYRYDQWRSCDRAIYWLYPQSRS